MVDPVLLPLLFLDVDGTLLPMGTADRPTTEAGWQIWQSAANPVLGGLTAEQGRRLAALPCEIVWATAWRHTANAVISPALGLPQLPVARLPESPDYDLANAVLHWKTLALAAEAAGRPFAWVDDEHTPADEQWLAEHYSGPVLLHRIDASIGLTSADLTVIEAWLIQVAAGPVPVAEPAPVHDPAPEESA